MVYKNNAGSAEGLQIFWEKMYFRGKGGGVIGEQRDGHRRIGPVIRQSTDGLMTGRCSGQHDFEGGEGAGTAFGSNVAFMELDNSFDNGQAET
jgi:hypothetical protein